MRVRIAVGGIHIESSTFTPYISDEKDFAIRRGEELLQRYPWREAYDVELIPLIHARALPGGIVSRAFYDAWLEEFLDLLHTAMDEAPLDGLLFDIHGAMSVEGLMDAEGTIAKHIRDTIGPDVAMSTSMDLHGNVSDLLFESTDVLTCYRTAPHLDAPETRKRAFEQLVEIIQNGREDLVRAKVKVPILLPGEKTSTEVEPGKTLYASIEDSLALDGIMDASIWMGFPWADQPRCHAVTVVTGYDQELVEREALALGQRLWNLRNTFDFVGPVASIEDAILQALRSDLKPYFISDTGDNPGAGGADDMVVFLRAFLSIYEQEVSTKKVLFASIKDEETVEKIWAESSKNVPSSVTVSLGGKIDPSFGGPLESEFAIKYLFEDDASGQAAVLSKGTIDIIVTSRRHQFSAMPYFDNAGITSFDDYDIIVVKMGYLEPDLSRAAKGWVMALTPGAVDQDLEHLPYEHLARPLYPLDQDFDPTLEVLTLKSLSGARNL